MAVKKKGLGRGLDGLFPVYRNTSTQDNLSTSVESEEKKYKKQSTGGKEANLTGEISKKKSGSTGSNSQKSESSKKKNTSAGAGEKRSAAGKSKDIKMNGVSKSAPDSALSSASKEDSSKTETKKPEASKGKPTVTETSEQDQGQRITMLRATQIEPNKNQPRTSFNEESLNELADSIRQHGMIEPLIVEKKGSGYQLIAGERRWRAARLAGLKEVPVMIRDLTEKEKLEISLIENLQREDLNPIEEARAYQRLMEEFSLTQEEAAKRVSKSRAALTNTLRLLKLDERVQQMIIDRELSAGHARALLSLENPLLQYELAQQAVRTGMSVRDMEKAVKSLGRAARSKTDTTKDSVFVLICQDMEERMQSVLGTKVHVNAKNNKKGKIEIEYYSREELERIYDMIQTLGAN